MLGLARGAGIPHADVTALLFPLLSDASSELRAGAGSALLRLGSKLTPDDRAFIDQVLEDTRMRRLVFTRIRDYFRAKPSGADHAG